MTADPEAQATPDAPTWAKLAAVLCFGFLLLQAFQAYPAGPRDDPICAPGFDPAPVGSGGNMSGMCTPAGTSLESTFLIVNLVGGVGVFSLYAALRKDHYDD